MEGSVNFGVGPAHAVASGGVAGVTFTSHGTSLTTMVADVLRAPWEMPRVPTHVVMVWWGALPAADGVLLATFPATRVADLLLALVLATLTALIVPNR